jgi:1-acyl-sn-glycerol-3-phosphate acyltransferase
VGRHRPFFGRIRLAILLGFLLVQTVFWSAVSILLFLGDHSGRLTHRYGARPWSKILLWASRVTVSLHGIENLAPDNGSVVFVSNHQSMFDILALLACLPVDFKFVVKKELMAVPLWGYAMKKAGYIFIDREDTSHARELIRETVLKIQRGSSILFFAEGTRSEDGRLAPFKRGAFFLASQSGRDVVPLVIQGSRQVLPKKSLHIRSGHISIAILPPVTDSTLKKNSRRLMAEVRERMSVHLHQ